MLSQNQIKPSSITLANLLSMLGFRERQQLDFIKLMAFRTCFNKPTLSIIDKSKESITKNWQNEVVDSLIPIWEEAKLKEIYYSHSNRIINDIEAEELLNINFLSLEKGLAWVEGVTQLKFLRSSFFDVCLDHYAKERIDFIQPFKGSL